MTFRANTLLVTLTVVATLMVAVIPASATFPGKNGRIAFVVGPDIFTMNPDGSDVRQLTNLGPDNFAFWQSWSPDGKKIVFNEFRPPDFNGEIWLMNADGSNQQFLFRDPGFDLEGPSFSPDGKTIIFSRGYDILPDTGLPLIVQMYRIGVDGKGLTQITTHTTLGVHDYWPKYSPER